MKFVKLISQELTIYVMSKIVITISFHGPMVGSRACKVGVLGSNPQMAISTNHLFNPFLGWVENTLNVFLKFEFVRRWRRIGRAKRASDCMRYIVPPWSNPCLSSQFQLRRQEDSHYLTPHSMRWHSKLQSNAPKCPLGKVVGWGLQNQ